MALTGKQQAFARAVVEPDPETGKARSLTADYRLAYDTKGCSPKTIRIEASRLRASPDIALAVDAENARVERLRARDEGNRARSVLSRLDNIADTASDNVKVQALRLLGLECGLFRERQSLEITPGQLPATEASTVAELEATLREVLALESGEATED